MNDLHITLSYLTSAQIKRIGESMRSDPSDTTDGWYIRAYCNEGYDDVIKYTRLDPSVVANAVSAACDYFPPHMKAVLTNAVIHTNNEHALDRVRLLKFYKQRTEEDQRTIARLEAEK